MNKIMVISAIVDTQCLTLYTPDGNTHVIMQGDPRVRLIIDKLSIGLDGPGSMMEIDLDEGRPNMQPVEPVHQESSLKDFAQLEEQSGVLKFFKVAKKAIAKFFGSEESTPTVRDKPEVEHVEPVELGSRTTYSLSGAMAAVESAAAADVVTDAASDEAYALPADAPKGGVEEVMANARAIPASSPEFKMTAEEEKTHDVVAVVSMADGSTGLVPNAHKLATQVAHATKTGNSKGIEALLKRMAAMPNKRQHSVEDLMKFIERGDLPITDDGRIVFYKLLEKRSGQFGYADCHTGLVQQGVNVEVRMDESLVDHNRNNECSNGLHVARRQYLRGFGGTDCFMGTLAPEDVIAVPTYDSNKMRVCGYQLHFHLSDTDKIKVKNDTPFDADSEAAKQLALIIAGKQAPVTHRVTIGGQRGSRLTITELNPAEVEEVSLDDVEPVAPIEEVEPLQKAAAKPEPVKLDAEKIDPSSLAPAPVSVEVKVSGGGSTAADQNGAKQAAANLGTPRGRIAALLASGKLDANLARQINDVKRAAKKGYDKLGVDADTEAKIKALL